MTLKLFWILFAVSFVKSSHFRGAFVSWIVDNSAPGYLPNNPYGRSAQVNVRLGMSWRRSDSKGGSCNDQTIQNRNRIASSSWSCKYRQTYYSSYYSCTSSYSSINQLSYYYCDNYNIADDYTVGYNNFTWYPYLGYYSYGYKYNYILSTTGCCWVNKMVQGSSSSWYIQVQLDFERRPDNKSRINSSPQVSFLPVYHVEVGHNQTFSLPVWDPDGDILKCRWAKNSTEGGGIYHYRDANLTENCQFIIPGNLSLGWYPVAIMVEDFFNNDTYGHIKLSSIPLQFTFKVNPSNTSGSECRIYTSINDATRKESYTSYNGTLACDNKLAKKWYRFITPGSNKIPETCVARHHCGTHAPGWLSGFHPTVAEGTVTRQVCYHWYTCCNWKNNIRVRNCSGFYVYELQKTVGCSLRYCTAATGNSSVSAVINPTSSVYFPMLPAASSATPFTKDYLDGCKFYQIFTDQTRSVNYNDWNSYRCDKELYGWYRFMGQAGNRMLNFCPTGVSGRYKCGSYYQGWLHGSQPSVNDGSVPRTVCFSPYYSCSCSLTTQVYVKNCGSFYVYWLNDVPACNLRYCGIKDLTTVVTCSTASMQVSLDTRYFNYSLYSSISFKDSACRAYYKPQSNGIYLTTSLTNCGTTKKESNNHIIYENEVQLTAFVASGEIITRNMNQKIKVSCSYSREGQTGIIGFKPVSTVNFSQPGFGNFTFHFWMYTSKSYRSRHYVYPVTVQLRDWLYFETSLGSGDNDVFIIVEKCFTTPSLDRNDPVKYIFIKNRCPSDPTVQFINNNTSSHQRRFSIQAFRFVGNMSAVYVHCEVFLCHRSSTDSRCHYGCYGNNIPRVKRKKRSDDDVNIQSVSRPVELSAGPVQATAKDSNDKGNKSPKTSVSLTVITMGIGLTVLVIAIAGLVVKVAKMKSLARVRPESPPEDKYKQQGDRYMPMQEDAVSATPEDITGITMKNPQEQKC